MYQSIFHPFYNDLADSSGTISLRKTLGQRLDVVHISSDDFRSPEEKSLTSPELHRDKVLVLVMSQEARIKG